METKKGRRRIIEPVTVPNGAGTAKKRADRDTRSGKFKPGNKAAKNRKPKQNEFRQALEAAVRPADFRAVAKALLKQAKAGDLAAIAMLCDRLLGRPRIADCQPMVIEGVPAVKDEKSALEALSVLVAQVAGGSLSADAATRLAHIIRQLQLTASDADDWRIGGEEYGESPDPTFL